MTIDPRERFTGLAAVYQRSRPSYPPPLFDWIFALFAPARPGAAADVGCGTGISTRLLAARGIDVTGVDPNEDMLAAARAEGGPARYVRGDAESTGLAGASVDLVTAAQALHWFDRPRAFAEFARILRPGGWCVAWWNRMAPSPINDAYRDLRRAHAVEGAAGREAGEEAVFLTDPGIRDLRTATFAHVQRVDRDGFLGRIASNSRVHHGTARRDEFFREADAIFARHAKDGCAEIAYECRAYGWRPEGASG